MATTGVAVVTGAGSGLGRSITRALLSAGWQVAAAGRREQALRESVAPGAWPAESALVVPADVTVPESVAGLFGAVQRRWGRVDLLVNNAGVFGPVGAVDDFCRTGGRWWTPTSPVPSCAPTTRVRMMKAQTPRGGGSQQRLGITHPRPRPSHQDTDRPDRRSP
jgi:NAD(P)-dependent dehydrogenase (short-subunit alcohol dehydrogenase family)